MFEPLRKWFLKEKRDLPWRHDPSPYAVWVSEVMLQQTRVSVVVPYFIRWMDRFPTVEALSLASLDEVIKLWEGLGYYSRARNLLEGAKYVQTHFNSCLPNTYDQLKTIKGLGPYTIGAILNFAFKQKVPCVDGNVLRVFSRLFAIEDDIGRQTTKQKITDLVAQNLPEEAPWVISEGLIELGAKICKKKPDCTLCPMKSSCQAFLQAAAEEYPVNLKKTIIQPLFRLVGVIFHDDHLLLRRGAKGKIMSDLHEFPFIPRPEDPTEHKILFEEALHLKLSLQTAMQEVSHSFTRYRVKLYPSLFSTPSRKDVPGFFWAALKDVSSLAFSSGHKKILQQLTLRERSGSSNQKIFTNF